MKKVWLLRGTDGKLVGIYSSEAKANGAKAGIIAKSGKPEENYKFGVYCMEVQ